MNCCGAGAGLLNPVVSRSLLVPVEESLETWGAYRDRTQDLPTFRKIKGLKLGMLDGIGLRGLPTWREKVQLFWCAGWNGPQGHWLGERPRGPGFPDGVCPQRPGWTVLGARRISWNPPQGLPSCMDSPTGLAKWILLGEGRRRGKKGKHRFGYLGVILGYHVAKQNKEWRRRMKLS